MSENPQTERVTEIRMDPGDGPVKDLLAECLKNESPGPPPRAATPPPPAPQRPAAANAPATPGNPIPLPRNPEALLGLAIARTNEARTLLDDFVRAYPYLLAPNVAKLIDEHLKENQVTMSRVREQRRATPGNTGERP